MSMHRARRSTGANGRALRVIDATMARSDGHYCASSLRRILKSLVEDINIMWLFSTFISHFLIDTGLARSRRCVVVRSFRKSAVNRFERVEYKFFTIMA